MTDKQAMIQVLTNSETEFEVKKNSITFATSPHGDKTTILFNEDGSVKAGSIRCN